MSAIRLPLFLFFHVVVNVLNKMIDKKYADRFKGRTRHLLDSTVVVLATISQHWKRKKPNITTEIMSVNRKSEKSGE